MIRRISKLSIAGLWGAAMLAGGVNTALAGPIGDTACSDPASTGFGTVVNCGTYIDTIGANDGGGPLNLGGTNYLQLEKYDVDDASWNVNTQTDFSITALPGGFPSDNGTWGASDYIMFIVIKSGSENSGGGYSVYGQGALVSGSIGTPDGDLSDVTAIFEGALSGAWATAPTIVNQNNGQGRDLSHLSFYGVGDGPECTDPDGCDKPVPEPGPLGLLGLGLIGLALKRRKFRLQNA